MTLRLRTLAERELDDHLLALLEQERWFTTNGAAHVLGVHRDDVAGAINRLAREGVIELDPDWLVWCTPKEDAC